MYKRQILNYIDAKTDRVDGIIGGPPCQAYSTIGRAINEKKKNSDDRIYLYKYYLSFLNKYSPKFFIFENVKGLQSFKDVDGLLLLPKIKSEFRNAGYIISDKVINSSDYGVSQNRERLFIFGLRNDVDVYKRQGPIGEKCHCQPRHRGQGRILPTSFQRYLPSMDGKRP